MQAVDVSWKVNDFGSAECLKESNFIVTLLLGPVFIETFSMLMVCLEWVETTASPALKQQVYIRLSIALMSARV